MIGRGAYTLLLRLALPFALARLWWRGRRDPGYRAHVAERFGRYAAPRESGVVWVHAVSVGEARAAEPLVRALAREFPARRVLVTCTTVSGRETVRQVYGDTVLSAYLPYDLPAPVRRFREHFQPAMGVLMETELWPNLLGACRAAGVPVVLANARLSEKSARGYARWASLARAALGSLAAVCAQSESDARRLKGLGAGNVVVTGNLKFDVEPDPARLAAGRAFRAALGDRPILLLASTREGEEALLLDALAEGSGAGSDALVVVVPRHPLRFDEVARLAAARGLRMARRSRGETPSAEHQIYLGDTLGEMPFYFAACDVAVMGGSFMPLGGQNLIEACAAGAPVIVGPSVYNFAGAARLAIDGGAALQVADARGALRIARELLADPARRARMGVSGSRLVASHRGATGRHLEVMREAMRGPPGRAG